jgi:hypothetical protein
LPTPPGADIAAVVDTVAELLADALAVLDATSAAHQLSWSCGSSARTRLGEHDGLFDREQQHRLVRRIPGARLVVYPTPGTAQSGNGRSGRVPSTRSPPAVAVAVARRTLVQYAIIVRSSEVTWRGFGVIGRTGWASTSGSSRLIASSSRPSAGPARRGPQGRSAMAVVLVHAHRAGAGRKPPLPSIR